MDQKTQRDLLLTFISITPSKHNSWVDKHLGQATGKLDQPLGGICVILFGDFGHLPPVDVPLHSFPSRKHMAIDGYTIYQFWNL